MNILFVMSISGSIVFLLYLLTKPFSNRCLTARWQYNFLKICMAFYLIPYQCFQSKYLTLYNLLFGTGEAVNPLRNGVLTFEDQNTIFITSDGRMHYKYWLPLLLFSSIWICAVAIVLYRQIKKYRSCRDSLFLLSETSDAKIYDTAVHRHNVAPSRHGRHIRIIVCPLVRTPFSIGLFRPVVVLPKQNAAEDLSLYLSHEWHHIKNHDMLWKFLSFITILLHWYNPLAYLLFHEVCAASEKTCDVNPSPSRKKRQWMHDVSL